VRMLEEVAQKLRAEVARRADDPDAHVVHVQADMLRSRT
jgi:hypothetical protein